MNQSIWVYYGISGNTVYGYPFIDHFREELHDDIHEKIRETRSEASDAMTQLKQRAMYGGGMPSGRSASSGSALSTIGGGGAGALLEEGEGMTRDMQHAMKMREIQKDNHSLQTLVIKMHSMNKWKMNHNNQMTTKLVS